jgi:hypothetical protein
MVSKWACPDMFAYILMLYLVRCMDHPPKLNGLMQLDIGFTCFCLFCLGSTIATLGISLPEPPSTDKADKQPPLSNVMAPCIRTRGLLALTVCLTMAATLLLVLGVAMPCMALRLKLEPLYENGTIPPQLKGFVEMLNLPELLRADVSIWNCIIALARWTSEGEVNSFLGCVLLAVFVVAFTALDIIVLNIVAVRVHINSCSKCTAKFLAVSRSLKKCSMLDVLITGVVITVMSGSIYRSRGLILSVRWGLLMLLGAEICHYIMYLVVTSSAELAGATPKGTAAAQEVAKSPNVVVVSGQVDEESVDSLGSEQTSEIGACPPIQV